MTEQKRPETFPQPCWSTPRGTKTGQNVPETVPRGIPGANLALSVPEKKASPGRGWLLVVSRFRLRVRVLLDLGLGGGETGVKINHLRSRCKHTVNNALKTAVRSCFQYLWFLCLSITKFVNLIRESKMLLSLFSGTRLVIGVEKCDETVYSKSLIVAEPGFHCVFKC